MPIIKKYKQFLLREMTEFNLQRFNSDSVQVSTHVDDPNLSLNAFDKHQDAIRSALSRVNDIMNKLTGTEAYSKLRSKLALENQDIKSMKIIRIVKDGIYYDVYISFIIDEEEYWGVVKNIIGFNTEFKSEVFKDYDLLQIKEWVIKIKGLVIKTIKEWLKPEPGMYTLIGENVICYSTETGSQLVMDTGIEVEVVRSHSDKIIIRYDEDTYNLKGDNYIYFNWWFQKID
jgi:hypothetical protein